MLEVAETKLISFILKPGLLPEFLISVNETPIHLFTQMQMSGSIKTFQGLPFLPRIKFSIFNLVYRSLHDLGLGLFPQPRNSAFTSLLPASVIEASFSDCCWRSRTNLFLKGFWAAISFARNADTYPPHLHTTNHAPSCNDVPD